MTTAAVLPGSKANSLRLREPGVQAKLGKDSLRVGLRVVEVGRIGAGLAPAVRARPADDTAHALALFRQVIGPRQVNASYLEQGNASAVAQVALERVQKRGREGWCASGLAPGLIGLATRRGGRSAIAAGEQTLASASGLTSE